MIINAANLTEGFQMLVIGMGVVFIVLLLLYLLFDQLKHLANALSGSGSSHEHGHSAQTAESTPSSKSNELSADVNAAISMAIYLYLNEQHDHESGVVTINYQKRKYSPWNSKIYGMNNIIKK